MARDKITSLGGFEALFNKSVPHILEKIFFSLDYDSFRACRKVHKTWVELLSSDRYTKELEEMLIRKEENEEKLCKSSRDGNVEVVSLLLSSGVSPNCLRSHSTPLINAAMNGHKNVVKILLDAGAEPTKKNEKGKTPLYEAAQNGHRIVVKILLSRMCQHVCKTMVELLSPDRYAKKSADMLARKQKNEEKLRKSSRDGNVKEVSQLLSSGVDPNCLKYCFTPLINASISGHDDVVKLLLDAGAEPNMTDTMATTPLHEAAGNGHIIVVKILLDARDDPNTTDENGRTPLYRAAMWRQTDIVELLLDAGA